MKQSARRVRRRYLRQQQESAHASHVASRELADRDARLVGWIDRLKRRLRLALSP